MGGKPGYSWPIRKIRRLVINLRNLLGKTERTICPEIVDYVPIIHLKDFNIWEIK
jgi:hypothetical protein